MDWNGAFFSLMALGKSALFVDLLTADLGELTTSSQLLKTLSTSLEVFCIFYGMFGFWIVGALPQHAKQYGSWTSLTSYFSLQLSTRARHLHFSLDLALSHPSNTQRGSSPRQDV